MNFTPSCFPWRRSPSAAKPQLPSSLVSVRRDLLLIGEFPSFVKFPRLLKCSSSASSSSSSSEEEVTPVVDGSVVDYRSSITSGSNSADIAASVWDADLRAPVSSSTSHSPSVVDDLEANYRSPASPPPPPVSTDSPFKYDVFISFRGPDSGDDFVSHLYEDLRQAGIETFFDREKLVPGEEIEPALNDAIERSRISVVVFTKDYASSNWCLRELARIMVCMRCRGQLVLPVFLGVEPMDVRWQRGCYSEAFSIDHKAHVGSVLAEEVKRWRQAMTDSANLSGFVSTVVRPDSNLVDTIVAHVLEYLESNSLHKDESLVGACHYVKEVEDLLEQGSDEVRTIGICGIGGSGKTAIAGAVFNHQHQKFDSHCFLANVREQSNKHGLLCLRNKLFRKILDQADINIATPDIGSSNIRDRLRRKRVLIVLDDVSSVTQLKFLIEQPSYFGPGSRILITTRDMNVIKNVDYIYSVNGISDSDSLELFSHCAFKQSYPTEDYLQLSMRAAAYAMGIPLALKVMGSFLSKRSVLEWESALRRLDSSLDEELFNVLHVSYDGLNVEEKAMFLHLACLFDGEKRNHIADLLDGCGCSAEIAICALVDKCMITFTNDNRLQMHDLLRKMGRQIVKQESPQDPSKRSRLWSFAAVKEVLTKNTGTISTEGISLDLSKNEELRMGPRAFAQMHNLRFLRFVNKQSNEESCKIHLPEGLDYLPSKLRLVSWDFFPLKNWPGRFIPENLVELRMHNSRLKRLWQGVESLLNFKRIDLSNSLFLMEFPDLSNAPKVEWIDARGCSELVTIPTPRNKLESLVHLDLSRCSKLKDFPEISWNIKRLYLAESGIEEIPPSIGNFHQLVVLDLKGCKMLKHVALIVQKLEKLEVVDLSGCSRVTSFPAISCNVKEFLLNETSIEEIPSRIKYMRKLVLLELKNCPRLKNLPSSICELKSLVKLILSGSSKFTNFPEITETMDSLRYLLLSGSAIKELPSSVEKLIALYSLDLETCKSLASLPDNLSKLKNLHELNISGCSNLVNLPGCSIGSLVNVRASGCRSEVVDFLVLGGGLSLLKTLGLSDCGITEFPEALTLISTLMELDLSHNCFSTIPPSIKDLQDLRSLDLSHCKKLQSLLGVPAGLTRLNVLNCKSLETVALSDSSELQVYPYNNVETFVFAGCPSLSQDAIQNIEGFAKRRIHVLASHLGVILNFSGDDLSLNSWMKPPQIRYLLSSMYGYGNLHEALIGLHTAFFNDELILKESPSRLLGRILHDFHERYRLGIQDLLHFFSYIEHLYLYYQGKPSTSFSLPGDGIPEWFCHQSNGSFIAVVVQPPKHSYENSTLAGFAISVLVAFDDYKDDKGISIKYECHFHSKFFGTHVGAGYLRGWDGEEGKPLSIEGDHMFLGFDSSVLLDAADGIEQFVLYSEDLVEATFQCYVVDEDGNPIKSCTVKKCAVQPLYTSDMTKFPKEILRRQNITNGWATRFPGLLEKVLRNWDLYRAISLDIRNVLGDLSVDVFHQGGYVYITVKCENAGLPISLQFLNVQLGIAPLAVKLIDMAEKTQDPKEYSIEFSDYVCRIKVKKCEFRQLQRHVMGARDICFNTIKIKCSASFSS